MRLLTHIRRAESEGSSSHLRSYLAVSDLGALRRNRKDCDRGLGDLLVIRVAGNIVAPSRVGSVEFAAARFVTRPGCCWR